jgi:hypothetical protein
VTRRLAALAAVGVLLSSAATGCAGSKSGSQQPVNAGPQINVPIRLANCTDWRKADAAERLGTVRALRNFAGGAVVGAGPEQQGRGAVLDDKQAYSLFQRYCAATFARGFKLYKLYERAAAFGGHH